MKIGASTACLYPLETEKALEKLAENGILNIEIFFNAICELEGDIFCRITERKRSLGLNITSVHPFQCPMETMGLFSEYSRRTEEYLDIYKRYFEAMSRLECPIFVLHGAKDKCSLELYAERYLLLSDAAAQFGVTVAQENVIRCKSGSMDFLVELKKTLGDRAAFVLDLKQALRCGVSPFALQEALGSSIVHCHISDSAPGQDCLPVGEGNFEFRRLIDGFRSRNGEIALITELYSQNFDNIRQIKTGIDILTQII